MHIEKLVSYIFIFLKKSIIMLINFNNNFESLDLSVLFEQLKQIIYDYNCNNKFVFRNICVYHKSLV